MTGVTEALEGLLATLPTGHVEKPGVIRAIEIARLPEYRGDAGGEQERARVLSVQQSVRRAVIVEVLRTHNPRPLISASPGSAYYGAGLTARCVCGWVGTTQVATGLTTEAQRGLAEEQCDEHLAEKILERLG